MVCFFKVNVDGKGQRSREVLSFKDYVRFKSDGVNQR